MKNSHRLSTLGMLSVLWAGAMFPVHAGEWISLFDGKTLEGWVNREGKAPQNWKVVEGEIRRVDGGGDLWTKERYGDFKLELEFNTEGNSGVFVRTDDPKNNVQTGLEIQVHHPSEPNKHSVGALYDLVAPLKNAAKKGWNQLEVTLKDSKVTIVLNGETVVNADLDQWTEAGKNPDGSPNKFQRAIKEWKREGHIGLQDHDDAVAYRKIRLKRL